jgi:hydroxypyruvate isomerase
MRSETTLRFSANISMIFGERAFLERIDAAAHAGFAAVECQFPYSTPAAQVRRRLEACGLP